MFDIYNDAHDLFNYLGAVRDELIYGDENEPEPNLYNQLDKEQIPLKIESYLKESMERTKEIEEEAQNLKEAVKNLSHEKEILVNKAHEIEGKYNDLTYRHDRKTDLVGRLQVKTFILLSELERLQVQ